jgi:hypothetical protein
LWSDSGAAIVNKYGTLPVMPLREVIGQSITGSPPVSDLLDMGGIKNQQEMLEQWEHDTRQDAREVLRKIEFEEKDPEGIIAQYRIADRSLIVNSNHPFVQEHSATHAEK